MPRWLKGVIAGVITAIIGLILLLTPLGATFEQNVGLAWLFNIRGAIDPPNQVAIVAIDDQTGTALGLSKLPREWPRSIHARVVNELVRRGASVIVFDIDFQIAKQTETDAEFADAVANSGRVVLVEKLIGKRQPLIDATGKQTGSVWVEQLVPPISALTKAAKGLGPFPLPKVQVAVHQFWVFKSSMNAPTMPAVALQIHLMNAYPRLSELLKKAGKQPPTLSQQASATELVNFMGALRALFLNDPSLGQALRDTIAEDTELAIEQRDSVLALIGLYEGADDRYLNFYGQPGSILTIPYHLIAGANTEQVTLPELKDKVVFVGFSDLYDPGQPDRFYTVYTNDDGVDLSGVEIAATAFANLYSSNAIHPPNLLEELSIVVVFGCVIGFISYFLAAITAIPLMLLLVTSYLFGAQQVFNTQYLWIPVAIPILIQFPIALLSGLLVNYFSEKKKKERANQAIGFYLPENLARDFTEKNLDHNSLNKVTYSVCFASDMAGFTTIAELLNPKELAEFLNDYFETLSKPLKRHGVGVIEFRADGVMCAWTAESSCVEPRYNALLAGIEAVEAIAGFQKRYAQFSHSLRIGIEDGMAYVGHAGGGGHFVYSIVGDCANTAARIESLNKKLKTQLLVSASVLAGVGGLLCRFVGDFRFVGKTEPLSIYEVVASDEQASDAQIQLCQQFGAAMKVLSTGDWNKAGDLFADILTEFPSDGPSRFHLERCRRCSAVPLVSDSPLVIHLDSK